MEIRVTIDLLDDQGNVVEQETVLGETDELGAGLLGDVDAAVEDTASRADLYDEEGA